MMTTTTPLLTTVLHGLSNEVDGRKPFAVGAISLTYDDIRDKVARTQGLFDRLGLASGDRIAIVTRHDDAVCHLYGACLLSGVVAVVVDGAASASEVNVLLAKAKTSAVFADQDVVDRASALQTDTSVPIIVVAPPAKSKTGFGLIIRKKAAGDTTTYPALLADEAVVTDRPALPNDAPALILFTSGTTSQPKGVVLSRGNLAAQLVTFLHHYGYSSESRIGNHLPLHHTDGLNQGVLLTLALGSTWIRPEPVEMQSLGDALDLLYRERATHLITVPTVIAMMTRLTDDYDDVFSRDEFEFISSTAGYLDEQIWSSVEERFNTMVVNSYGLTETVMEALYCGPTDDTRRRGTIGKPVDCEARLVDDDGHDVGPGEVGELWLRGENVMPGYFEHPEATTAVMANDWLKTGDLARCDDGFYVIAGRKKNVIIRAGNNIYPEDVNSVLMASPGVTEAATIGIPDQFLGEMVVSCVTIGGAAGPDPVNDLLSLCRAELAPEKVPNRVLIMPQLPHGPSGKIELARVQQAAIELLGSAAVEGGDTAEQVLSIAARVFGHPVESLAPSSDPDSTPGWDSLSFLELIVSLERQFDMLIAPRDVMTLATLDDAIALVEAR